jgi:hypothetical protein
MMNESLQLNHRDSPKGKSEENEGNFFANRIDSDFNNDSVDMTLETEESLNTSDL